MTFDAIELEILWKRLISVVDEAAAAFVRTCFSTLVRDGNDFAIVLTDAEGRSLAQSTMSLPGFIGCARGEQARALRKTADDDRRGNESLAGGSKETRPCLLFQPPISFYSFNAKGEGAG